jgi:hypothetical protein
MNICALNNELKDSPSDFTMFESFPSSGTLNSLPICALVSLNTRDKIVFIPSSSPYISSSALRSVDGALTLSSSVLDLQLSAPMLLGTREDSGDPWIKGMRFLRFKLELSGVVNVEELLESLE